MRVAALMSEHHHSEMPLAGYCWQGHLPSAGTWPWTRRGSCGSRTRGVAGAATVAS